MRLAGHLHEFQPIVGTLEPEVNGARVCSQEALCLSFIGPSWAQSSYVGQSLLVVGLTAAAIGRDAQIESLALALLTVAPRQCGLRCRACLTIRKLRVDVRKAGAWRLRVQPASLA